jgi:DNA invertase Pin-like site-specific DNA recombinase
LFKTLGAALEPNSQNQPSIFDLVCFEPDHSVKCPKLCLTLVIWKLDRLGRSLHHLVNTVNDLSERGVGLKVLTGTGAQIDTTTPAGRLSFGIFAALADFESDLIRERTMAGLAAARARGRKGGRKFALSKTQVRMAQVAMANRDTSVSELCKELGIRPVTLYRYVDPNGELRDYGKRVLKA